MAGRCFDNLGIHLFTYKGLQESIKNMKRFKSKNESQRTGGRLA